MNNQGSVMNGYMAASVNLSERTGIRFPRCIQKLTAGFKPRLAVILDCFT